jgi:hypothetical protein
MGNMSQREGGWWDQGERWTAYMLMVKLWKRAKKQDAPPEHTF